MVANSGKAAGPGPLRPLNSPVPLDVREAPDMRPLAVRAGRRALRVTSVDDVWEIADEWWTPRPIARRYFSVALEDGSRSTLFRDLVDGGWYSQRP